VAGGITSRRAVADEAFFPSCGLASSAVGDCTLRDLPDTIKRTTTLITATTLNGKPIDSEPVTELLTLLQDS
jgi:hypothetical protein